MEFFITFGSGELIRLTLDRWHSKTIILSTNEDQTSLGTEFSIVICCQSSFVARLATNGSRNTVSSSV